MLFTGWEVHIGKNCDRGLNMLTKASGPRSQFFPIRTDHKPVNNLFIFPPTDKHIRGRTRGKAVQGVFHKKDIWKFWKIFGNLQKLLEIFGNSSKVFSHHFYYFLKFLENLQKSSEAFGNLRKTLETVQK